MAVSGGIISGMGTVIGGSSNGDLQSVFGVSNKNKGWFFVSAPICIGAKKKPFLNTAASFADMNARDTARAAANYGITIPDCTQAEILSANWSLQRPSGAAAQPQRSQDFEGYYHGAPAAPLYCPKSATFTVNALNDNAGSPCAFFVYQKSGQLAYGAPNATSGTVRNSDGRTTAQRNASLEVADLKAGSTLITGLTNPYLGIAFFSGTTFKGFASCSSKLIASQSTLDNNMFIMKRTDFSSIPVGSYTGKACVRYGSAATGYRYVPLPAISGVCNNTFTISVGGADLYSYIKRGLSTSNAASSNRFLRTTLSTVYITIRVTNNSGIAHSSSSSGWTLVVTIRGTVNGSSITPPDRSLSATASTITIAAGGTTDLIFKADKIWNQNPTSAAVVVSSGEITVECYLKYTAGGGSADFTRAAQQPLLSVTYG